MLVFYFNIKKLSKPLNQYAMLEEMLALRALGWSYMALSDRYKVPKSTIRYLVRKFGLSRTITPTVLRQDIRATTKTRNIIYDEWGDEINQGKSYAEYRKEAQERKWRKLTSIK